MPQNHHVLVVEDDPAVNALVGAYIELAGMSYRAALDGESAFRELNDRRPHLLVLDVMLPDTDGFEICRKVRANPQTCNLPIIFLTALADEESRAKGIACGATEYLVKPFDPDVLLKLIRRHADSPAQELRD